MVLSPTDRVSFLKMMLKGYDIAVKFFFEKKKIISPKLFKEWITWINVCYWETAYLPLPKPNILPKARSKC